jgi:hypothetical protein
MFKDFYSYYSLLMFTDSNIFWYSNMKWLKSNFGNKLWLSLNIQN